MECTSESLGAFSTLGAVLKAFCPCGLVRQALNYILRGVRIGADRVKITLFLRGAERVHVPTVLVYLPNNKHIGVALMRYNTQKHSNGFGTHTMPPN